MVRSSKPQQTLDLWAAALRDAAGPLSAYIAPSTYSLENVPLRAISVGKDESFESEIESRLDLGRADAFLRLLQESEVSVATTYHHALGWSQGAIKGKVHVPRYALGKARNDRRGLPVIFASRQATTPETLLVSEAFRMTIATAQSWKIKGGAEGLYSARLLEGLQGYESAFPWNELRTKARPSLAELVGIVEGRIQAGQVEFGSFYQKVTSLFSRRPDSPDAFEKASTPISMLVSKSPEFEDRIFELLCLAWLISALRSYCSQVAVKPSALSGPKRDPVATGFFQGSELTLNFQQSAGVLPDSTWVNSKTHSHFRAIPDLTIKVTNNTGDSILLVDAKNRGLSSESEVTYKLLVYKENLGINPFLGVALFPSYSGNLRLRGFYKTATEDRIYLVHVPIMRGREAVRRLFRQFLMTLPHRPPMKCRFRLLVVYGFCKV